jgi:hypothetical protein
MASHWRVTACVLCLFVFAALLRVAFVWQVQHRHDTRSLSLIHSDTREYVHLGAQLADHGRYVDPDSVYSHHRGLLRGPVVPVIWAGLLKTVGHDGTWPLRHALWLQIPLSMAVVCFAGLLSWEVFRDRRFVLAAMGIAAISPTGIAINGIWLADLPFAVFFLAGLHLAILSIRLTRRPGLWTALVLAVAASIMWAIASLTKPTLMFWSVPTAVMFAVMTGLRMTSLKRQGSILIVLLALPIMAMGFWSYRNLQSDGILTVSTISTRNLRYLVVPYAEHLAEHRRWPRRAEFRERFDIIAQEQDAYVLGDPTATAKGLYERQTKESVEAIKRHPLETTVVLASNLFNQLTRGWESSDRQIVGDDPLAESIRRFYFVTRNQLTGIALLTLGGFGFIRAARRLPGEQRPALLALGIVWAYVALLTMTTRDEGSRLMFPCEPVLIVAYLGAFVRRSPTKALQD